MTKLQQTWPACAQAQPILIFGAGSIVAHAHLPAYRKAGFSVKGRYDPNQAKLRNWLAGSLRALLSASVPELPLFDWVAQSYARYAFARVPCHERRQNR